MGFKMASFLTFLKLAFWCPFRTRLGSFKLHVELRNGLQELTVFTVH